MRDANLIQRCSQCLREWGIEPHLQGKIVTCPACENEFFVEWALPIGTPEEKLACEMVKALSLKKKDEKRAFERLLRIIKLAFCGFAGDYKQHLIFLPASEN